jgi:hypothetical protein
MLSLDLATLCLLVEERDLIFGGGDRMPRTRQAGADSKLRGAECAEPVSKTWAGLKLRPSALQELGGL